MSAVSRPNGRRRLLAASLFGALGAIGVAYGLDGDRPGDDWARCGASVAHALGVVDSFIYTNSAEAFERNYARGFRVFEVDLRHTRDSVLVAAHDWHTPRRQRVPAAGPTLEEFLAARIYGRYTPLTGRHVLRLLQRHPDVMLLLDLKEGPAVTLASFIREAKAMDPRLLDRTVPQLWSEKDVVLARTLYPFPSVVWSLHFTRAGDDEILAASARRRVGVVTLNQFRFNPAFVGRLRSAGIAVYVSTINSRPQEQLYHEWGASGVYTDLLEPTSVCPD